MQQRKYVGTAGTAELVRHLQNELQTKQDWVQFPELPSASAYTGKVVQYTGATTNNLKKGYFYYSNGLNWAQTNVMSAVVTCKLALPDWGVADPGLIYFVASEGKAYVRDNDNEGQWLNIAGMGSGSVTFSIVSALPLWTNASPDIIYLVKDPLYDNVTAYVKADVQNKFYKLSGDGAGSRVVTTLPAWTAAVPNMVYFLLKNGELTAYVKNSNEVDAWYTLAGGNSEDITLTIDSERVKLSEVELESITDQEITEMFEES